MDRIHPSPPHTAVSTQNYVPSEVVLGGEGIKTEDVLPPGGDQAQPTCFGIDPIHIPERSESDRLCSTCMSLGHLNSAHWVDINNSRSVIVDHHHSLDALLNSARGGCHLCGLLLMAWEEKSHLEQESGGGWVSKVGFSSTSLNEGIRLEFHRERTLSWMVGVQYDEIRVTISCGKSLSSNGGQLICKAMDDSFRTLPETCLPSGSDTNTGSSASLFRIKAWLEICRSSHPACSKTDSQPPLLPTRVIAVGQKGSKRCALVSGDRKTGYYATLSHCWGESHNRPLLTTDQTLSCRQQGIEDEALPKTFLHAVQVCRELDIKYIWIDSLCIIQQQETQEDWAKEAPRMGVVYGNSILNISAAAAADSTQGCFRERLGLASWPCSIVLFGQACYLSRYPTRKEKTHGDPGDIERSVSNVLASRAWVLQEQILSRRSITFSSTRLIWRCPTLSTNEKYPLGIPHAPSISTDTHSLLHCIINGQTSIMPKKPVIDNYACWYRIVEEFTSRNLTFKEDRLPAIAGIAKGFGRAVNDSYHAGLWRQDIILGLLWSTKCIPGACTTKSARVPSWSWASVDVGVYYTFSSWAEAGASCTLFSPLVDVINVSDPTTCEEHPFGVTSRASLSLCGGLLALMQEEHEDSGLALLNNGTLSAKDPEIFLPDVCDSNWPNRAPLVCLPLCVCHWPLFHRGLRDRGESNKASWERSLNMGKERVRSSKERSRAQNTLYCLVLQAVAGNEGMYSRVGICSVKRQKTFEINKLVLSGERRPITLI